MSCERGFRPGRLPADARSARPRTGDAPAAALLALAAASAAIAPGCGTVGLDGTGGGAGAGGGGGGGSTGPEVTVLTPDLPPLPGESACEVTITTGIPLATATHMEVCTDLDYPTNPPSGGPHWGVWASFTTYEAPLPREMYVHDMEHGAIVLLHRCEGACPEVLEAFADARKAVEGDPKCLQIPGGPTERVIVTPDPELDVPVAAAAWGATYKATCLHPESLRDFMKARYDKGPESTCASGFGVPDCSGGTGGTGGAGGAGGTGGSTGGSGGGGGGGGG